MIERARYSPPAGTYDEAVAADGSLRTPWSTLTRAFGDVRPGVLLEHQRVSDRLLDAEGAGHLVHELAFEHRPADGRRGDTASGRADSRPWRLDPVPLVLGHDEFDVLAAAAAQRLRVLELLLGDLFGEQRLVRTGVIPPRLLFALPSLRTTMSRQAPSRWIVHYAVDLARTATGEWRVVQDLTDAPSGLGYGLLNRSVMARVMPAALRIAGVAPVADTAATLRRAIAAQSPANRRGPRSVVLTGGPGHPTYVEHSYLAMQMGYHLAEGGDLVVRRNRVWLRVLDGVEPVDVVYRRLEDAGLDPLDAQAAGAAGVPAITWAAQAGGVALANAFGARLAEEPALRPWLAAAAPALLGESLQLALLEPGEALATAPTYSGERRDSVTPAQVVVRLHAIASPDGITVMRGGVGRVLAAGDEPTHPTAHLVKDVWVIGGPVPADRPTRVVSHPQVDFGSSVPKRAADALYWMGRAAERAEAAARTIRVIGTQLQQDTSLLSFGSGGWAAGSLAMLRAVQMRPIRVDDAASGSVPFAEWIHHELVAAQTTVAAQIATLVQEATSVREFLSTTTGRVLGRLTRVRADLVGADAAADDLDVVLVDLAALAGLAMESTVRGPAWRFLDMGRRIERSLALLGSIEAGLGQATDPLAFQPLAESVLAVNESLVAYRRRYRSDVELGAVLDLLVHDDSNPRSLAFQLDRLREHMASLAWQDGADRVQQASLGALRPLDDVTSGGRRLAVDALVLDVRGPVLELGAAVTAKWFADPVNPTPMGSR